MELFMLRNMSQGGPNFCPNSFSSNLKDLTYWFNRYLGPIEWQNQPGPIMLFPTYLLTLVDNLPMDLNSTKEHAQ